MRVIECKVKVDVMPSRCGFCEFAKMGTFHTGEKLYCVLTSKAVDSEVVAENCPLECDPPKHFTRIFVDIIPEACNEFPLLLDYMLEELRAEVALYREGTGDLNGFLDIVDKIIAKYSEG